MHMFLNELLGNLSTTTIAPDVTQYPSWVGYIGILISAIFFGSNFVPAAKYPIDDGVSYQFFLCCGIWVVGVVIYLIMGSPVFFPSVMIGGMLWTTGNCLSMFVIPINGLGVSMLLWCTSNLFMGWASGHFGWFGLKPEGVKYPAYNYLGVVIAVLSGFIFLLIKVGTIEQLEKAREHQPIIDSNLNITGDDESQIDNKKSSRPLTSFRMRIVGYVLAVISGIFFGLVFTPSTYIQDNLDKYKGATKNGLLYIFPMFTGILLTSFVIYSIYILAKRNRPYIVTEFIFPAFVSGIMWGIAQAGFIVANSVLSQAISYPIISIAPATIATLWSILYIKDILGKRNYLIFAIGTVVRIVAGIFIVLSEPK